MAGRNRCGRAGRVTRADRADHRATQVRTEAAPMMPRAGGLHRTAPLPYKLRAGVEPRRGGRLVATGRLQAVTLARRSQITKR
jgi:hypothetical protein